MGHLNQVTKLNIFSHLTFLEGACRRYKESVLIWFSLYVTRWQMKKREFVEAYVFDGSEVEAMA